MKAMICAAGLAVLAGQASALSCRFGDGAVAYSQAQGSGGPFRAVVGSITWDLANDAIHGGGFLMEYEGQEFDVDARFNGEVLLAGGKRMPIDENIRVQTWCANGDCGYATDRGEMLTFLHDTDIGTIMLATPCQSYPIGPSEKAIALVQNCVDGGACSGAFEE
jgi:hypothetical protein